MPHPSSWNQRLKSLRRIKVGVLEGGHSSERKISFRSGRAVKKALASMGLHTLSLDPSNARKSRTLLSKVDIAFIALHGEGGEDGLIQRDLEKRGIPYVGSAPIACRRSFDKKSAKRHFRRRGIATPDFILINKTNWKRRINLFKPPFFIKPLREGSSLGVFCVDKINQAGLARIKKALRLYGELLVERKITGRELTVGILGSKALPVIELRPRRRFYDYIAKYTKGKCRYLVPAPLARKQAARVQRLALKAHKSLGMRDFSRVDLMLDEEGRAYVLEVNSIPGFTEMSLLPKAAKAAGINFQMLCMQLLSAAYGRRGSKSERIHGKKA